MGDFNHTEHVNTLKFVHSRDENGVFKVVCGRFGFELLSVPQLDLLVNETACREKLRIESAKHMEV